MTVTLTWQDTKNSGASYNIYRSPNTQTPIYAKIGNTGSLGSSNGPMTFTDTPANGSYVYYVTAVVAGVESDPSNTTTASVVVAPPTMLASTVS